jgi:UPF0716 protein FxsA
VSNSSTLSAMPLLLLFLFLLLPIAEIYVIVKVGQAIGILPTLAILLLDGFVGAALARSQGRAAWARFNRALAEGRIPARETFDGAMIIVGGALLLAPGFITDAVGFLLLIPPTRGLLRGAVARLARRRVAFAWTIASPPGAGPRSRGPGAGPSGPPRRSRGYDYEGTAREVSDPSGELEPGERRE